MGQLGNFGVGNGEALTVFFRYIDVGDRFTGFGFVGKDHFDLFRTHVVLRRIAGLPAFKVGLNT